MAMAMAASVQLHETDKAQRYIAALDAARLHGLWDEIPELARKVDKHAPHRQCLVLTATSEVAIAHAALQRPSTSSSVNSAASFAALLDVTPKLVQAIDQEKTYFEDAFQANVCLHEVYFLRAEWNTIIANLGSDVWQQLAQHTTTTLDPYSLPPNTRVAVLKSRYFLGVAYEQQANPAAAVHAYQSALRAITEAPKNLAAASEYHHWAERLLGRVCLLHTQQQNSVTLPQAAASLAAFRTWLQFWDQLPGKGATSSTAAQAEFDVPRREIWGLYYRLLSFVLATGLVYSPTPSLLAPFPQDVHPEHLVRLRQQQRTELKRVEKTYESLLINETRFPEATYVNKEVEDWVQQVISNWHILCGPSWSDADLGEGGKPAVARNVLDILYRAATKTFHSTPILRSLFSVHSSLAEFDLAIRAFDTYSDIVAKAKNRAEKTGEYEAGLDADDHVIITASRAIAVLCKYGSKPEAEKAVEVGKKLSVWLRQQTPPSISNGAVSHSRNPSNVQRVSTESLVSPSALATAYCAIGQSQATWARLNHEPEQREELRASAIKSLRKAASLESPPGSNPDTALLLATTLAESRDLLPAINVLKKALALSAQNQDSEPDHLSGDVETPALEQKIACLWHMLTLLLTARGEYENAVKICEAAFEQLDGPMLFQTTSADVEKQRPGSANLQSYVDQMDGSTKESLIQIRMTQLALMETLDSPATAVDVSSSLLALYHNLFGAVDLLGNAVQQKPDIVPAPPPPPSRAGGLKSISGSILGRSRTGRRSIEKPANPSIAENDNAPGAPLSVQTTAEEESPNERHKKHHLAHHLPLAPFKLRGHQGDWREVGNLKTRQDGVESGEFQQPNTEYGRGVGNKKDGVVANSLPDWTASTAEQPLGPIPHNIEHQKQPAPLGHMDQPPHQDVRLPAPHPATSVYFPPQFPSSQQRRRNLSILVEIWLFIAGQYQRARLFEDAEGAIDETQKIVDALHKDVGEEESSSRAFDEQAWGGGGKSVNRLWADVYAARGDLSVALAHPHDALASYEQALSYHPDHPAAVVGISAILLDIYEQTIPPEVQSTPMAKPSSQTPQASASSPSPELLNRLAARDRAYMLLSTLTKLGEGWDDSEAWAMLARVYELSGQVDRAKECLWWVVELEDGRPLRPWEICI